MTKKFQENVLLYKSGAMPLPTRTFIATNESIQIRYCTAQKFKGHEKYKNSK